MLGAILLTEHNIGFYQQLMQGMREAIADQRTLEGLGIHPEAIESIVPAYLARFRKAGQFESQKAA